MCLWFCLRYLCFHPMNYFSSIKLCSATKNYATFGTVCITNLHLHKRTVKSKAIHAKTSVPVSGRGFWTDERDSWTDGWPAAEGENKSRLYRRLITTSTKTRHLRQLAIVPFIVKMNFCIVFFVCLWGPADMLLAACRHQRCVSTLHFLLTS